jgi:conjugal transfer mating pair stabilization protein TraN
MRQGRCWIYEQTYQCPTDTVQNTKSYTSTSGIFCLTGNCNDASTKANGEMSEVISRLSMLKEIQDDIRAQQLNGSFQIFKGKDRYCSRNCVDFKDCCGGKKGWGVALALAMCAAEEKELAKLREQNLCHRIGSYCSKKVLGICVTKKTSFCCFGSKFSRLLQEQGRPQLGLDWGTAECPNCRGLTVEELSRIDFSKLDMREVFDEVMKKYKQPDFPALQEKTSKKIQENIQNIEQGLKGQTPATKKGMVDDKKSEL